MDFPSKKFRSNADLSTGLLFIRVYNKWHAEVKKELNKLGITHPQFVVLTSLSYLSQSNEYITQVQIAKMAEMDVMTISQIVVGLEKKCFLQRFKNPKDSRANAVKLTNKGEDTVKNSLPIVENIDELFFEILGNQECEFQNMLKKLY